MTIPLICFIVGSLILLFAISGYGVLLFHPTPKGFQRKDLLFYFVGYTLIAIALMLGLVGYFEHFNPNLLRIARGITGIIGLSLLFYEFIEINARP